MALHPMSIEENQIRLLIQDLSGEFHTLARQRLEIEDMEYQIDLETVMIKGDFPDENTKACVVPHSEGKHKLLFFTGSLCSMINNKFSKIYNADTFVEAAKTFIKFVFVHELVHIKQLREGILTEEYFSVSYNDNQWEEEANRFAAEIISEEGDFQIEIVKIILGETNIDSENVHNIISLCRI